MAGTIGRTKNSLAERLLEHGHDFDFFQAVRLLLRRESQRLPVGESAKPHQEVVRFHSRLTLEFPASAIHEIRTNDEESPPEMTVAFMGLTGTQGVLPFFYTEWMLLRATHKDSAMTAFFDVFNHRWISLFYRVWEKHRLAIAFERQALGQKGGSHVANYVLDLVGLGTKGLQNRLRLRDSIFVYYAGLVAQRSRCASSLRGLLRDFFGVPCEIRQFCGTWYELEAQDRCFLEGTALHNQLGVGAVLGDAVWDPQSLFEVRLGPLSYQQFRSFLPDGERTGQLSDLVRMFAGATAGFRVRLSLTAEDVPAPLLTNGRAGPRLGWDLWLGTPEGHAADDAVFAEAA